MKIQFLLRDISGTFKTKMAQYKKFKEEQNKVINDPVDLEKMAQYKKFKQELLKVIHDPVDLEKVKNYYKMIINSRRKLSRAKTLTDIFHLLEERDALDCNNVAILKHLGTLLQNNDINNQVHGYEKLYTEQETCVCGKSRISSLPIINPETGNNGENVCNELQNAVSSIALNIGKNWRILASELHVKEKFVDKVREKHPDDFQKQAQEILEIWIQSNGESATLEKLKKALESRLCKKKGVGLHMLKPPITVE